MANIAQIIPFQFESKEVRACSDDAGEPWFCAADVCAALGYANSRQAIQKNCREKGVSIRDTLTSKGKQALTFINEGNLYRLIIKSRKEEAQRFESWVCDEVLPAIRKHGHYNDEHGKMATLIGETIGTDGFHMLGALIRGKVACLPSAVQRKAKAKIWSQTHAAFGVRSAADIPATQLDSARNFVAAYALEGEWLPRPEQDGAFLPGTELYRMWFAHKHLEHLYRVFRERDMYQSLKSLGSNAGIEMLDHFKDGFRASSDLINKYAVEIDAHMLKRGLGPYRGRSSEHRG